MVCSSPILQSSLSQQNSHPVEILHLPHCSFYTTDSLECDQTPFYLIKFSKYISVVYDGFREPYNCNTLIPTSRHRWGHAMRPLRDVVTIDCVITDLCQVLYRATSITPRPQQPDCVRGSKIPERQNHTPSSTSSPGCAKSCSPREWRLMHLRVSQIWSGVKLSMDSRQTAMGTQDTEVPVTLVSSALTGTYTSMHTAETSLPRRTVRSRV